MKKADMNITSRGFRNTRVKGCPLSQRRCVVRIEEKLRHDLAEAVGEIDDEFIVFLVGSRDDNSATVSAVYVPRQRVTRATVEADEPFDPRKFVGIAHSHHAIGAFHSATDEHGVDNAPLSIVMSREAWCAKMAHRLPCGLWGVSRNVLITSSAHATEESREDADAGREVRRRELGDCPFRDRSRLPCGLRVRRNALIDEIRAKSETPPTLRSWIIKKEGDK